MNNYILGNNCRYIYTILFSETVYQIHIIIILDNVGDNVGDVAGMGADLFESFCGSIIGCVILAENAVEFFYNKNPYGNSTSNEEEFIHHVQEVDIKTFIAIPFWITGFGIVSSCVGIFLVRTGDNGKVKRNELQHKLLKAINTGILTAATLSVILSLVTCGVLLGWDSPIAYKVWGCVIIGLFAGILIGQVCDRYIQINTLNTWNIHILGD